MRALIGALALVVTMLACHASAPCAARAAPGDAGPMAVVEATGDRAIRPGGLRRGALAVPAWVVVAVGSAVALGAATALAHHILRRRR